MILPDVNVLIYAFRADSPRHAVYKKWLNGIVLGDERFGMSPLALSAVCRITTDSRIFTKPSTLDEAFAYADNLLSQPHCEIVEPGERHGPIFRDLCVKTGTRGPRMSDAWFAALAIEHGCTFVTFDRDYARFPGLSWQVPGGPARAFSRKVDTGFRQKTRQTKESRARFRLEEEGTCSSRA